MRPLGQATKYPKHAKCAFEMPFTWGNSKNLPMCLLHIAHQNVQVSQPIVRSPLSIWYLGISAGGNESVSQVSGWSPVIMGLLCFFNLISNNALQSVWCHIDDVSFGRDGGKFSAEINVCSVVMFWNSNTLWEHIHIHLLTWWTMSCGVLLKMSKSSTMTATCIPSDLLWSRIQRSQSAWLHGLKPISRRLAANFWCHIAPKDFNPWSAL